MGFEASYYRQPGGGINYSPLGNGERFIMVRSAAVAPREIHVVLNWFDELKQLVPTED